MTEIEIVEMQLEREINNYLKTVFYCPFDFPAVILVNPFINNIVAPTIYWLSCPYLNYKIDVLEAETNLIDTLGQRLNTDSEFKHKVSSSHNRYSCQRRELLDESQLEKAKSISLDLYKTLVDSGVGGIKDKKGIKCLHTHLADYLVNRKNPVGKIVFNKIDWPQNCQICQEGIDEYESSSN